MTKKKKRLPHWFLYVAWVLCFVVIFGCSVIIVLYGMQFGNRTSLDWLATVTLSVVQDFLLFQPAQILLVALIFARCSRTFKKHLKRGKNLQLAIKNMLINQTPFDDSKSEHSPKKQQSTTNSNTFQDAVVVEGEQMQRNDFRNLVDHFALEKARERLEKHQATTSVLKELIFYTLFAGALFIKVFSTRAESGYAQSKDIQELLRLRVRPNFNYAAHNGTVFPKVRQKQSHQPISFEHDFEITVLLWIRRPKIHINCGQLQAIFANNYYQKEGENRYCDLRYLTVMANAREI